MEKLSGLPGPLLSTAVPNSLSLARLKDTYGDNCQLRGQPFPVSSGDSPSLKLEKGPLCRSSQEGDHPLESQPPMGHPHGIQASVKRGL